MLQRISISNTKKFFQKALRNFKSFLCPAYQKLPKTTPPPRSHLSFSEDLDKFYTDVTHQLDSQEKDKNKKKAVLSPIELAEQEKDKKKKKKQIAETEEECETNQKNKRRSSRSGGKCVVELKKLRELEMLEKSDVDHVLDIEEVLHYYSRLNCPFYLDIVDQFFMQIYAEFFDHPC